MNARDIFSTVFGESSPMPEVTIKELENLSKELFDLYQEEEKLANELKVKRLFMTEKEVKFQALLESAGKDSYHSEIGTFSIVERKSVKIPKTIEAKSLLFSWLKEQNIYDEVVSINSQTLNKLYRESLEESEKKGDVFFRIPGLEDPTISPYLSFRRKK